ncbi:MAG: uracil phosphoribosyltransferase [Capnocytophaga sp.]|nr:uracil phosphoribosyltransferase [Capnocytophaga sp.]
MTSFFKGIQWFFEDVLFTPYDALRKLELESWWLANTITWVMIVVLFIFFFYWIGQLSKFSKEGTERTDATAHSYFK